METKSEGTILKVVAGKKKTLKFIPEGINDRKSRSRTKNDSDASVQGISRNKSSERRKSQRRSRTRSINPRLPATPAPSKEDFVDEEVIAEVPQQPLELTTPELCREVMEEFRQEAWDICMDRLMFGDGHNKVVFELRDTWLRIVEAEWMDEAEMSQLALSAPFLKPDEAPFPMSFDHWSKGALEILPHSRRESVMDPFIHSLGSMNKTGRVSGTSSVENIGGGDGLAKLSTSGVGKSGKGSNPKTKSATSLKSSQKKEGPQMANQIRISNPHSSKKSLTEGDGPQNSPLADKKTSLTRVFSKASASLSIESIMDMEFIKPPVSITSSGSIQYRKMGIKPWTVSQCGGKDGTQGVFRLVNQTTSEAIMKSGKYDQPDTNVEEGKLEATDSKEVVESEMMDETLETVSQSDKDTETLYENVQNDETDGTSKSISIIPSDLEMPQNNKDVVPPREKYIDHNALFTKGLQREAKSKHDREKIQEIIQTASRPNLPNPKRIRKTQHNNYKPKTNLTTEPNGPKKAIEQHVPDKTVLDSKVESQTNLVSKLERDDGITTKRAEIAKSRNKMIKQHRDSIRSRLSKHAN